MAKSGVDTRLTALVISYETGQFLFRRKREHDPLSWAEQLHELRLAKETIEAGIQQLIEEEKTP